MADVLIVCVREDEPQAKALADMFESAGFSIGGAPNSDAALRSSGAGVVVWSQASIRSRAFLDAAQRVINANKAVVASLIEPPPPSSIGDATAFDLSRWNGDPDDPSLDPLFFAVDRMVNSARAAVGAAVETPPPTTRAADYAPPPRRPEPPPRRAPPPAPAPSDRAEDALDEAAFWRSIRNSRDPAVFLDYLARYGPDGEFSDVAELRLKQLTAAGAPQPRPATPPRMERQARVEPPPPRRPEPPRYAEPPRRADPPPRVAEAAPPRRRDPPDYERRYDRVEAREPKADGGALRALVLIVLLGGAALAGALYLGGGRPAGEESQVEASAPPATNEEVAAAEPLDEPSPEPLPSMQAEPAPLPQVRREEARREEVRREEPRREQPREQARRPEPEPEPPTPAPVTNWNTAENARGPTSLSPGAAPPVSAPVAPPPAPVAPAAVEQPRPAPPGEVRWAQRPSARSIAERYPPRALDNGASGRVVLSCNVLGDLSVSCAVASETPAGMGFGRAAVAASRGYRAQPTLSNGAPAAGAQTRVTIEFRTTP
jgi:protein TonB